MKAVDRAGELIVVDNNSTDATAEIARGHGAKVVFEPVNQIARARNTGVRSSVGRYLICVDADTIMPVGVLRSALDNLEEGSCGGGALLALDRPVGAFVRFALHVWNGSYAKFGYAAGCFIYCRRDAFDAIGGFDERLYAGEEIFFSRRLRAWGRKHGLPFRTITDDHVVTSCRKLDSFSVGYLLLVMLMVLLFPFAIRFRSLCWIWYRRPPRQ